jgi:hypothetical protein
MASIPPSLERAVLGLLGVVIVVLLVTGIVGAVMVNDLHGSHVASGAGQPVIAPGPPPESSTSESSPSLPTLPVQTVPPFVPTPSPSPTSVFAPTSTMSMSVSSTTTTTTPPCTASVSDPTPSPGGSETIGITSHLRGASAKVAVHFRNGDAFFTATTDSSGRAQAAFTVPKKETPGLVAVDVTVLSQEHCQTAFTVL